VDINLEGMKATEISILGQSNSHSNLEVRSFECDVSVPESVSQAFAQIAKDLGRIDYAANCAGVTSNFQPSTDTSIDTFERINNINYRGIWLCAREELKVMKEQKLDSEVYPGIPESRAQRGAIVHVSSGLGLVTMPGSAAYCGAKAAVISLTRCDALDYSPDRIRVNTVMPGVIDTPMTQPPDARAYLDAVSIPATPMKRFGQPEEVADAIVFLCSNKASYVQGAALAVDGGYISV
jgi:NAD(P)-dependent dehydrogenase (short-subunit alcohol dehydrogenase family)